MANASDILAGSNDEDSLDSLYRRIESPRNRAQALFVEAWEVSGFIASDGFECLFEQQRPIDDFAQLFVEIGFSDALPVFQKVGALVPGSLLVGEYSIELRNLLTKNFDGLKQLFYEYLDIADARLLPAFGDYVRNHKEDFLEQLTQN